MADPHLLPLKLKPTRVRTSPTAVEVDGVVEDATGANVQSFSLSMPPETGFSGACASLQRHAEQMAQGYHQAKRALHAPAAPSPEAKDEELAALVGRTFEGSVSQ